MFLLCALILLQVICICYFISPPSNPEKQMLPFPFLQLRKRRHRDVQLTCPKSHSWQVVMPGCKQMHGPIWLSWDHTAFLKESLLDDNLESNRNYLPKSMKKDRWSRTVRRRSKKRQQWEEERTSRAQGSVRKEPQQHSATGRPKSYQQSHLKWVVRWWVSQHNQGGIVGGALCHKGAQVQSCPALLAACRGGGFAYKQSGACFALTGVGYQERDTGRILGAERRKLQT